MALSFIKVYDGQTITDSHLNYAPLTDGLQQISIDLITAHHHVDPTLFTAVYGEYGSNPDASYSSAWQVESNGSFKFSTPTLVLQNTVNFQTLTESQIANKGNGNGIRDVHEKAAIFSLRWISGGDIGTTASNGVGVLNDSNPTVDSSKIAFSTSPPNHYSYLSGTPSPATLDKYGFWRFSLFAGNLPPGGISLAKDVNSANKTFLDHIRDTAIHFRKLESISSVTDNDHYLARHGYLNIYDVISTEGGIASNTFDHRYSDDYPLNPFEFDSEDLEKVQSAKSDFFHPVLYEEGFYLYRHGKLKQYKLINPQPEDITVMKDRAAKTPIDSLFVGGGPGNKSYAYSDSYGKFLNVINSHLDSYWIGNHYRKDYNVEWGERENWAEQTMSEGLGYQPRNGFSTGV